MHVEPSSHPANVLSDETEPKVTVSLGAPTALFCYAYGWPKPSITWWRGDKMLPLSSQQYEQKRDYSLLIHSVRLSNLGIYTCQAYNGLGKAASYSVTVQAYRNPNQPELGTEEQQYLKYLVDPTPRPHYPGYVPQPYTEPSPEIIPEQPRIYYGKYTSLTRNLIGGKRKKLNNYFYCHFEYISFCEFKLQKMSLFVVKLHLNHFKNRVVHLRGTF